MVGYNMKRDKKIYSGELNKKMWGISKKKALGWYANGHRGELLTPPVELNEDLRYIFYFSILYITLFKNFININITQILKKLSFLLFIFLYVIKSECGK